MFFFSVSPIYHVAGNLVGIKFGNFSHNIVFFGRILNLAIWSFNQNDITITT